MRDILTGLALVTAIALQSWMGFASDYPPSAVAKAVEVPASCPPSRPHARTVRDLAITTCRMAMTRRLVCESAPSTFCGYQSQYDCDLPPVRFICLSDEELRDAQAP